MGAEEIVAVVDALNHGELFSRRAGLRQKLLVLETGEEMVRRLFGEHHGTFAAGADPLAIFDQEPADQRVDHPPLRLQFPRQGHQEFDR